MQFSVCFSFSGTNLLYFVSVHFLSLPKKKAKHKRIMYNLIDCVLCCLAYTKKKRKKKISETRINSPKV